MVRSVVATVKPGQVGHSDVQEDGVRPPGCGDLQRVEAAISRTRVDSCRPQVDAKRIGRIHVVVDDEDALPSGRAGIAPVGLDLAVWTMNKGFGHGCLPKKLAAVRQLRGMRILPQAPFQDRSSQV